MSEITLYKSNGALEVAAEADGLWFRSLSEHALDESSNWPPHVLSEPGMRSKAFLVEQCVTTGLAARQGRDVRIPCSSFSDLDELGWDLTSQWTKPCLYLLRVGRDGDLGRPNFRYKYQLLQGSMPISNYVRVGCFLQRGVPPVVYRLDPRMHELIEAMDAFNALPSDQKGPGMAWARFGAIRQIAESTRAILDDALAGNDVVMPSSIGLAVFEHDDGSVSFTPTCPDVDSGEFKNAFLHHTGEHGMFTLSGADGKRVRLVLNERQQEVLDRMRTVRRVRGERKSLVLENPAAVFDGVADAVDGLPYGKRVISIGGFTPVPTPRNPLAGIVGGWELPPEDDPSPVSPALPTDPQERAALRELMEGAVSAGREHVEFQGKAFPASRELIDALAPANTFISPEMPPQSSEPAYGDGAKPTDGKFLIIHTDEEQILADDREQAERARQTPSWSRPFERPQALRQGIALKPHQEEGVRWLQTCVTQDQRRGVLLADDMGLGKTLQVLTFIAWCIESGRFPELSRETGPFRPVLVVAPLVLIENDTWLKEIQNFFAAHGSVFQPVLTLHGTKLKHLRKQSGTELQLGEPVLDLSEIRRHRLVITNYETVTRFQHSFAYHPDGKPLWSMLITDEAQEFKTPSSKISHAIKAIQPAFSVASTGTPVENRLLDLWNVFDALQPALLGSAREFSAAYERSTDDRLDQLKERLLFQQPHAFLLRRDKRNLPGLPAKKVIPLECEMLPHEKGVQRELIAVLRNGQGVAALKALHKLALASQHPDFADGSYKERGVKELIRRSTKLTKTISTLHQIRRREEKAIIFARHIVVQEMLSTVIAEEFGITVKVLNGDSRRASAGKESRARILQNFREAPGFGVIVLSPFVAGVGLTVTEANHVIHYGRWWNPAVESQATDRAYRIGQTKDVHVYLPILVDPARSFRTFDEQLNGLLDRRQRLAEEFLRPIEGGEEQLAEELMDALRVGG